MNPAAFLDFESGTLFEVDAHTGVAFDGSEKSSAAPTVFAGDFKSGDLANWSTGS